MASRKEYEMLFQLNAQLGGTFSGTFSKAQQQLASMQKEIQALSKTQSDIAAYQKQQSAVEATRSKLAVLQQQYDNIQKEIKETEGYSSSLENKLLTKQQQIEKTSASLKDQTSKLETMGNALKDAGVDTDNLSKESAELSTKMNDLKKKQEEVADGARKYGTASVDALEAAKSALMAAGLAKAYKEISEEIVECVKASIEFESAITGVFKTVDGTDEQLAEITQGIKDMSTEIPATTTEIASVAEAAGQLGIATDDVLAFTRVMIDLGESTNLSADDAASSLAKFANITGTSADNYSRLGSVVVDLGNNFATTEADIVAMSTRLASAGTISGLTEAEIMALATAMSSVGIEAEAGGTAMAQTLNAIETAVATQSAELTEFARIAGMTAAEFSSAWNSNPIEALQAFIAGLGGLDAQGESTVLVLEKLGLTGIRQSNMLKSLGLAADTLGDSIQTANKAWDENTALTIEAGKRYATTESQLKMLRNSYGNLQVAISDIGFLQKLSQDAGFSLKITNNIIVIFDQAAYESKASVKTILKGKAGGYTKYKLNTGKNNLYTSCRVSYTDTSGNLITATAYVKDYDESKEDNQCLEIKQKVANTTEALALAKKMLRLHNKYEFTATFDFPGDPTLLAGLAVELKGWGAWDGKYIIKQAKHTISNSGYTTQITLRRALNFDKAEGAATTTTTATKSVDELAREVIRGNWGNGAERKRRLTEAGYDYNAVQKRVNELLYK